MAPKDGSVCRKTRFAHKFTTAYVHHAPISSLMSCLPKRLHDFRVSHLSNLRTCNLAWHSAGKTATNLRPTFNHGVRTKDNKKGRQMWRNSTADQHPWIWARIFVEALCSFTLRVGTPLTRGNEGKHLTPIFHLLLYNSIEVGVLRGEYCNYGLGVWG